MSITQSKRILTLAIMSAVTSHLRAQTSGSWIQPAGGTWTEPSNWNSGAAFPDRGGTATFGSSIINPSTITLNSGVTLSAIRIDSAATYSIVGTGSIFLSGPATISVNGPVGQAQFVRQHSILVPVTGAGGVVYEGTGPLLLGSATYTGQTIVNGGQLAVSNGSFGATTGTVVLNGGYFAFRSNAIAHELHSPVMVTSNNGTLGVQLFSGNKQLTILAPISGVGTLTLYSSATVSIQSDSPFNGTLRTLSAPLVIEGNGRLPNTAAIDVYSSLIINKDSVDGTFDKIGDLTAVNLSVRSLARPTQGIFVTSSSGAVSAAEQIGTITLNSSSVISTASLSQLAALQIIRKNNALLKLGTSTDTSSYVKVTGAPPALSGSGNEGSPDVGIVSWMHTWDSLPITSDSTGRLRPLDSSEYITVVPAGATASNLILTNGGLISQPISVNSLTVRGGTLNGTSTITVASGKVLLSTATGVSSNATITAPINFGAAEGIVSGSFGTLTGSISGTGGLTIWDTVTLNGASTYTGPTNILSGLILTTDVLQGVPNPLGLDAGPVLIRGPVTFKPVGAIHFDRNIAFRDFALISVQSGKTASFNGTIDFSGGHSSFSSSATIEFNNSITGAGTGGFSGGTLSVNASSPLYIGRFGVNGALIVNADQPFGTGTLEFSPATLIATGAPRLLTNALTITAAATITGSQPITVSGLVSLDNFSQTLTVSNSGTTTFTNAVSKGSLVKKGIGRLEVGSVQLTSLSINEGPFRLLRSDPGVNASKVGSLLIGAGASLDSTNNSIVVDYNGASPSPLIRSMLIDGRLFSSDTDAWHTLGYIENGIAGYEQFAGVAVDPTSLLIQLTVRGDANLDHKVDIKDLYALASNWQTTTPLWSAGDFNYDGVIDVADLTQLAMNWQAGTTALGGSLESALVALSLPSAPIPEPNAALVIGGAAASLCARRRRPIVSRGELRGRDPLSGLT